MMVFVIFSKRKNMPETFLTQALAQAEPYAQIYLAKDQVTPDNAIVANVSESSLA
jgi:fructose-specific component phosphotransferase system IIB-like protein